MKTFDIRNRRTVYGILFVTPAVVLLVTALAAQAQDFRDEPRTVKSGDVYDSEFLGGLWASHDGPNSRQRNFFPFYYESGEGGSSTWSSPLLLSGGRIKKDGSEEYRFLGGIIRQSIDRGDR
jgi:hypothetical protein